MFRNIVYSVYCAVVLWNCEVNAMGAFVLDESIDPKKLRLGEYSAEVTANAILRTEEVINTIEGFDRSTPSKLCEFLTSTNSHFIDLTKEQRVAFRIYLERLAYGVPGESKLSDGKFCVIALASVLSGYSVSVEDFQQKRLQGDL
ncbi:MAG: hypothetical protein LBP41_03355 [Holosporaceae bacterium]|jgi:hypothetical protein|nr:hypothetical protein [Holosporaceae bacterium]